MDTDLSFEDEMRSRMSNIENGIADIRRKMSHTEDCMTDIYRTLHQPAKFKKLFMDPVHGSMVFEDELLIKIIDTPQFQRLRNIKQLGGKYYVFPEGAHNRFEHSLGVCHLAGKFIRTLRESQPELQIHHKDIRHVEIAALCHDLGHGPFSHAFEHEFIEKREELKGLKHEQLSAMMLDYLIQQNNLSEELDASELREIKKMIQGVKDDDDSVPADKRFLYQIVANKSSGVDVDKWDYFARDCHHLGIANSFDHNRCMKFSRVIKQDDGSRIICFRDKEADNLYQMFHVRYMLHRRAYQHKVSTIIEHMIMDALNKAEDAGFRIFPAEEDSPKKLTIAETLIERNMHAYTYMTDSVVDHILCSSEGGKLQEAREILRNVLKRDKLYKLVHEKLIPSAHAKVFLKKWKDRDVINEIGKNANLPAKKRDLIIAKYVTINYGKKDQNPIKNVYFYSKSKPDVSFQLEGREISLILPMEFQEIFLRIYCQNADEQQTSEIKYHFENWFDKENERMEQDRLNRERGLLTPDDRVHSAGGADVRQRGSTSHPAVPRDSQAKKRLLADKPTGSSSKKSKPGKKK